MHCQDSGDDPVNSLDNKRLTFVTMTLTCKSQHNDSQYESDAQLRKSLNFSITFMTKALTLTVSENFLYLPTDFYSAPQCSHCKRCTTYTNSVCLSVCLSVCHTPVLCQNDCM